MNVGIDPYLERGEPVMGWRRLMVAVPVYNHEENAGGIPRAKASARFVLAPRANRARVQSDTVFPGDSRGRGRDSSQSRRQT
jgi:hypothetical protein